MCDRRVVFTAKERNEKNPQVFGVPSAAAAAAAQTFVIKTIIYPFYSPNANNPLTHAPRPPFASHLPPLRHQ